MLQQVAVRVVALQPIAVLPRAVVQVVKRQVVGLPVVGQVLAPAVVWQTPARVLVEDFAQVQPLAVVVHSNRATDS